MALRTALLVFIWCLSWSPNGAEGRRRLSKEEDLELEKQLRILNKPAVKTIRTKYGDTYNCVDFYQQPAFDEFPSLRNHTFQYLIKPSSYPKGKKNEEDDHVMTFNKPSNIWLNGKGCPHGTVPIRKFTKDDLIKTKLATEIYASKLSPLTAQNPGVHYAVLHTNPDTNIQFHGSGMRASLYNPNVEGSQYSSSHLKLENGPDSIEVGWMVNPTLYNDSRTRLFIYTNAGRSHCFNTYCSGFITVHPDIPVDFPFAKLSTRGGVIWGEHFFIYRDANNGNWFLELGNNKRTIIGFWPKNRFTRLADFATYIEWGGEVYSPPDQYSPPMGSGIPIVGDRKQDAYCSRITFVNLYQQIVDALDTSTYKDINEYGVKDQGYVGAVFKHLFLYGGPGGYQGGN